MQSAATSITREQKTLVELAAEINRLHDAGQIAGRKSVEDYHRAGKLLIDAKQKCEHGKWLLFLKSLKCGERNARRYMALAKSDILADLNSCWRIICGAEEPTPDEVKEEIDDFAAMSGEDQLAVVQEEEAKVKASARDESPAERDRVEQARRLGERWLKIMEGAGPEYAAVCKRIKSALTALAAA